MPSPCWPCGRADQVKQTAFAAVGMEVTLSGYLVKNWYSSNKLCTMQWNTCFSRLLPLLKLDSVATTSATLSSPVYSFCANT